MKVGARTLISRESAAAWRRAREIAAQDETPKEMREAAEGTSLATKLGARRVPSVRRPVWRNPS